MHQRKGHVAIFVSSLFLGGAERNAVNLANEMSSNGLRVDLVVMNGNGELRSEVSTRVNIIDMKTNRGRRSFVSLVVYIQRNKPDSVLSILTVPNILLGLTRLIPMINRPLLVGSEHSYFNDIYERSSRSRAFFLLYALLGRVGYRLLNMNIAVSQGVKLRMVQKRLVGNKKVVMIPNPIDLRSIPEPYGETSSTSATIKLLAVGRLNALKDYPTMFKAIDILRRNYDVELFVLGDGEEKNSLMKLIHNLNLEEHVKLIGTVMDTGDWFRSADAFVLSSEYEGFSNVIVEALAHGVPVVSTDCPSGPAEILTSYEYGVLVSVGDYEELARGVISVVERKFDRQTLRKRAQEYNLPKICNIYLGILGVASDD